MSVKSPVRLHTWSFPEERALLEFVGLALMDPKYGITSNTQWPAFRDVHQRRKKELFQYLRESDNHTQELVLSVI